MEDLKIIIILLYDILMDNDEHDELLPYAMALLILISCALIWFKRFSGRS